MQYVSKEQFILDHSRGKRVLHLGCVGFADLTDEQRVASAKKSLHWKLTEIADVTGIDYSAAVVEEYRRLGVFDNILVGNVMELEALKLPQKFDVVVAGDIIEHISNPGRMLDGIRSLSNPSTEIIITTPNSFGLPNFLRYCAGRFHEGGEHVLGFNTQQMEGILERHGLKAAEMCTCYQSQARAHAGAFSFALGKKFFQMAPRLGGTILTVARLPAQ
jgi:2-polyprenyl-3-methyl-5-hydroxy-6-metoxy-1,4-benzoquinol methylase